MSELESLGVQVAKREKITSSTSIQGMELSSNATTKLTLALPNATPLKLSLSKEGFGRKLTKLFKKELMGLCCYYYFSHVKLFCIYYHP